MRRMIGLILAMVLVAAAVRAIYMPAAGPTRIAIYDRAGGVNITNSVQHMVGHRTGEETSAPPRLGALSILRDDPEARGMYLLDPNRTVHVFLIGVADDPVYMSFAPTRWGHEEVYFVDLDRALETAAE